MPDYETEMDYHWRNTMKPVRFFMVDARAGIFLVLFIFHMRLWTLGLFIVMMLFFWMLEKRGLVFSAALRSFRTWLLGRKRPAWLYTRRRKFHDYG